MASTGELATRDTAGRRYAAAILEIANADGDAPSWLAAVEALESLTSESRFVEALQADGNWNWAGLLSKIAQVCRDLPVPVIAKEVGWGIGGALARDLVDAGVAAIDVAGAGGTSWSQVELYRAPTERLRRLARAFADWGLPTAVALTECRASLPHTPLIASGGIRSGLDALKCIALGADLVGLAGPFLKAAAVSTEAVLDTIDALVEEMRIGLFCAGAPNTEALTAPGRLLRVA